MPDGPGCFRQGSTCLVVLRILSRASRFRLRGLHPLRLIFQYHSAIDLQSLYRVLQPRLKRRFGLLRFRSPLLTESLFCFLLLQVLRCFNSLGSLLLSYLFTQGWCSSSCTGFPHSDTPGSLSTYDSPRLFAVCRVLLLLYMPRHSPYALLHLITSPYTRDLYMVFFAYLLFSRTVHTSLTSVFTDFRLNLCYNFRKRPSFCLFYLLSSLFSFQRTIPERSLRSLKTD